MPRKTLPSPPPMETPRRGSAARTAADPNAVVPATRHELMPIALASVILGFLALMVSASRGWMLLYGDAVAHLGIARRILDARYPGLAQLGGVWLPLPHLLMLPFVQKTEWWQNGLAGAWPSLAAFVFVNTGCYALARKLVPSGWAFAATAFVALNPNLLYLSTTAMTEPLFLAELVWSVVVAAEAVQAMAEQKIARAKARLVASGLLTLAMVMTRYDGWVVGAAVWCVLAVSWWRAGAAVRRGTRMAFAVMTVLVAAGPVLWLGYNAVYEHDWLDWMRGPYSAAAIERKTTPPGSKPRRGWHNPGWAFLYYTRAAQVDAVAYELGFAVAFAALAGAWLMARQRVGRVALLLWVPLPFYVYSIAWGNVPLFLPQMYPGSYYNSRYGMEMLPALAVCTAAAGFAAERRLRAKNVKWADALFMVTLAAIAFNAVAMTGTFGDMLQRARGEDAKVPVWLKRAPVVYEEGVVNARTRIPFEQTVAREMERLGSNGIIMFNTNDHMGAVQMMGIPLKSLISPLDSQSFDRAAAFPAKYANLVVAIDGDPVAKAVAANQNGLNELEVVCNSGQGCARFYGSTVMTGAAR